MKRVLLSNAFIKNYTGSELDTIEIANYFLDKKYEVDIFTLDKGFPLIEDVNPNIRIITFNEIGLLHDHYDLLWTHHYPLLDYIIFSTDITFDYINHVCLSSFEPYEQPPFYYDKLNMLTVMSYNSKLDIIKSNGLKKIDNFSVFPNYASKTFFDTKKKISKKIKKIAIVSNHIPKELIEFTKMDEVKNITIDIYGTGYKYVKIDEKVLSDYDVVISIGKTCYYSIAMKIPTYSYDYFGGPGYITSKNILEAYQGNFGGKSSLINVKKTKEEIYDEIFNNYPKTLKELNKCKRFALKNFYLEKNMNDTLKKLYKMDKVNLKKIRKQYPMLKTRSSLFITKISNLQNELDNIKTDGLISCQLFYDKGNEFNELDSIRNYAAVKKIDSDKTYNLEVNFIIPTKCSKIRLDMCEKQNIKITNLKLNGEVVKEKIISVDEEMISINNDPFVIIEKEYDKGDILRFTYSLKENK